MTENENLELKYGHACRCGECGAFLSRPGAPHTCAAAPVTVPAPEPVTKAPEGPDKTVIWEDCPQCAYKHLAAAYAALTSGHDIGYAHASEVYVARAVIGIRESGAGYLGNLDLAAGCLAMAECESGVEAAEAGAWRRARLALAKSPAEAEAELVWPGASAFAAAHLTEALRELPELGDRVRMDWLTPSGFDPDPLPELRDTIRKLLKWVRETYELGGPK